MKRVLSMICAVVLCLGMAGCGGNKQVGDDPTAVYLDGEKVISLGMTRDEIEEILELDHSLDKIFPPEEDFGEIRYKNDISIRYTDNIANLITLVLSEEENKQYGDFLGISLGMDYDKAKKKISKQFVNEKEDAFNIKFDEEGKMISKDEKTKKIAMMLSYMKNDYNEIGYIFYFNF